MKANGKKEFFRALKYTLIAASAGLIQVGTFALMYNLMTWDYWVSYLISLILSVIWNFTFNRRYTFKSATNIPIAMLQVFAFYIVFTPLSTLLGDYLVKTLLWNGDLVMVLTMLLNFVLEFVYQRYYVFRKSLDTNKLAKPDDTKPSDH